MRRISPLTLLFFLVSCNSAAQEQVVAEASDTVPSAKVTLLFVGDLMQHKAQLEAARTSQGTHDYSLCFSLVKEQISRADIAIGNLEVTLGGKPYTGYPAFSAPDEFLYAIRDAGFDILLTANNHCLAERKVWNAPSLCWILYIFRTQAPIGTKKSAPSVILYLLIRTDFV